MGWALLAVASAVCLAACSSAPKDSGFEYVQGVASRQTGVTVQWIGHTAADQALADAVDRMLAHPLSAEDAVQIALLNNRHLQARFEDLGIAAADLVQAGLLKNPVFDIGVRFPDRGPAGTYLDFAAGEDFLDIVLIPARKKLAAAQFEQVKAAVADDVLTLAAATRTDFYAYQAAVQTLELRRTMAGAASAALESAKVLHQAGNTSDFSLANERAQAIQSRVELIDAEADEADAREKVTDRLGLLDTQTHWIAAPLPAIPSNDLPQRNLESLAISRRQDFAAARQEIVVEARTLGLTADYRFFSDFTIGPEFERETDGQWRIGPTFSFPLPLFDNGDAKIWRAQALLRQKEFQCLALALDIQSQVRSAETKLRLARERAVLYRDQVLPAQRDLMHQTELQFNGMFVGVFQLLQARSNQIEASRQYLEATKDYWTARSDLELAVGGRLADSTTRPTDNGDPP